MPCVLTCMLINDNCPYAMRCTCKLDATVQVFTLWLGDGRSHARSCESAGIASHPFRILFLADQRSGVTIGFDQSCVPAFPISLSSSTCKQ